MLLMLLRSSVISEQLFSVDDDDHEQRLTTRINEVKRASQVNLSVPSCAVFWTNSSCLLGRQPPNWKMNNDTAEECRNRWEKQRAKARAPTLTILLPNCTEILLFDFKWATIIWNPSPWPPRLGLSLAVADCVVKLWTSIVLGDTL